ncbi:unnamed protein product [Calypogeia fissa]
MGTVATTSDGVGNSGTVGKVQTANSKGPASGKVGSCPRQEKDRVWGKERLRRAAEVTTHEPARGQKKNVPESRSYPAQKPGDGKETAAEGGMLIAAAAAVTLLRHAGWSWRQSRNRGGRQAKKKLADAVGDVHKLTATECIRKRTMGQQV